MAEYDIICQNCGVDCTILVNQPGMLGFVVDFCPICGEEVENDNMDEEEDDED
jgi:hypothetical protein